MNKPINNTGGGINKVVNNKLNKVIDLKWKWTIIIALLAIGVFNPFMYTFTDMIFMNNGYVYDHDEMKPTSFGMLFHLFVFMGLLRIMFEYEI
tara:strand:+ start:3523 stop:3801 length:279 start_codon:yes stop_codon:yes gene_type:complete